MNKNVFRAALQALVGLSREDLVEAKLIEPDSLASWKQFQDNPFRWFCALEPDSDDELALWSLLYRKLDLPVRSQLPREALPFVDKLEMLQREASKLARRSMIHPEQWAERAALFRAIADFVVGAFIDHDARVSALLRMNNQTLAELRRTRAALSLLDWAFCSAHGRFPADRVTEEQRLWNDAMVLARQITGDDLEGRRLAASLALAGIRNEKPEWWPGMRGRMPGAPGQAA